MCPDGVRKEKTYKENTHKGLTACGPQALPGRPGFATEGSSGRIPHNSLCVRARLVKRLEAAGHTNFSRPGNFPEQILVCPQTVRKTRRRRHTNFSSDFSRRALGFQIHGLNGSNVTTNFPSQTLSLYVFLLLRWHWGHLPVIGHRGACSRASFSLEIRASGHPSARHRASRCLP